MRLILLCALPLMACSTEANHLGNPLLLPVSGLSNAVSNASYREKRGKVELHVKTTHGAILTDIADGGGPSLTRAMDLSGIPQGDRPTRITQLQGDLGLYADNPGALIVALMVYGD